MTNGLVGDDEAWSRCVSTVYRFNVVLIDNDSVQSFVLSPAVASREDGDCRRASVPSCRLLLRLLASAYTAFCRLLLRLLASASVAASCRLLESTASCPVTRLDVMRC